MWVIQRARIIDAHERDCSYQTNFSTKDVERIKEDVERILESGMLAGEYTDTLKSRMPNFVT